MKASFRLGSSVEVAIMTLCSLICGEGDVSWPTLTSCSKSSAVHFLILINNPTNVDDHNSDTTQQRQQKAETSRMAAKHLESGCENILSSNQKHVRVRTARAF